MLRRVAVPVTRATGLTRQTRWDGNAGAATSSGGGGVGHHGAWGDSHGSRIGGKARQAVKQELGEHSQPFPGTGWLERDILPGPKDGVFGNGWDNMQLEIVFRSIIKRPHIREGLKFYYAWATDERTLGRVKSFGDNCDIVQIQLAPDIGDPHRILKQFSIMDAPVIDIDGKHVTMNGGPVFYDDDGTKIAVIDSTAVDLLAKEILITLSCVAGREPEPKDARKLLEDMYGDVQTPDSMWDPKPFLTDDSLLYPEDVWPEVWKGGPRYGKYQRGLGGPGSYGAGDPGW